MPEQREIKRVAALDLQGAVTSNIFTLAAKEKKSEG
jgi:hypothetical protein